MAKISIYSTPTCSHCKEAKDFFKEHNFNFEEFNVANDAKKRQEMITLSGQLGVPVIRIGDDVIVGFNQPVLEQMLAIK